LRNWVESEVFHRPLKVPVEALLTYGTVSGGYAKELVAEVDREMLKEAEEHGKNTK
jgi:hypothetical protein